VARQQHFLLQQKQIIHHRHVHWLLPPRNLTQTEPKLVFFILKLGAPGTALFANLGLGSVADNLKTALHFWPNSSKL
jgi:hypothetical protein